jgi:hypothetical protein
MGRAIVLVCIGALAGAGAVLLYAGLDWRSSERRAARAEAANTLLHQLDAGEVSAGLPAALLASTNFADRSMLVLVAARADATELRALIEDAVRIRNAASRRFALQLLVSRLAEIDPYDAIDLVYEAALGDDYIATVYTVWADTDPLSALRSMQAVGDPDLARKIADALFKSLGADDAAADRILGFLPRGLDPERFQLDVLAQRAEDDPHLAYADILAISDDSLRYRALMRVAAVWAKSDPRAALAAGESLDDFEDRWRFQAEVMQDWSREDPAAALQYLSEMTNPSPAQLRVATYAFRQLANHDPQALMRATSSLPQDERMYARVAAFRAWAQADPTAAVAAFESLSGAAANQRYLLREFGKSLAEADPEMAMLWARSQRTAAARTSAAASVIAGIARTDPGRAVEMVLELDDERIQASALQQIGFQAANEGTSPERFADAILRMPQGREQSQAMSNLLRAWGNSDPRAAVQWMQFNEGKIDTVSYSQLGQFVAYKDPELALSLTAQIPEKARTEWVRSVASGYAEVDPDATLAWIQRMQGTPQYDAALAGAAGRLAAENPRAVLDLLGTVQDPASANQLTSAALQAWSHDEPAAAAAWLAAQPNEAFRLNSLSGIARQWARQDPDAAKRWALELPQGAERDEALTRVLESASGDPLADVDLIDRLGSASARQQAALGMVRRVAKTDRAAARRLIDDYITDPMTVRRAEEYLARSFY